MAGDCLVRDSGTWGGRFDQFGLQKWLRWKAPAWVELADVPRRSLG